MIMPTSIYWVVGLETTYDDGLDGVGVQVQNDVALQSVYSWKERR